MSEPRFPFVAVVVPAARADEIGALLFELGAAGLELQDEMTWVKGPGPDRVRVVASFADHARAEAAARAMASAEPSLACEVGEIVGDDWRDKYKEHFKPFRLTPHIVVVPPWETQAALADKVLVMDPGRAFGTGLHATTAMVAGVLDQRAAELAGARMLDVGTGSGVLALCALLLGAESAVAIDNDPEVLGVARENADRNALGPRMEVSDTPLQSMSGTFDVVAANIRCETLIQMAGAIAERARPGALVILSGVLAAERDEVLAAYAAEFDCTEHIESEEGADAWIALVLRRR